MANALDIIKVKYGQKTGEEKTISYLEFLNVEEAYLSEKEKKVQEAMKKLHHLNENNPPLLNTFPNWRPDKPLCIDTIGTLGRFFNAGFVGTWNVIRFNEEAFKENLFLVLTHELKHAEDCTKERFDLELGYRIDDGLAYHQLGVLLEARARACELAALMLDFLDKKKSAKEFLSKLKDQNIAQFVSVIMPEIEKRYEKALISNKPLDTQEIQQLATVAIVPVFVWSRCYKDGYCQDYNETCEIRPEDKGVKELPTYWGVLPQYQEPLLGVLHASFQKKKKKWMKTVDMLKKLNIELDFSPFFRQAAENGLVEDAKVLIEAGLDINQKDNYGWTLFHSAALTDNAKIAQFLLKAGADKNAKDKYEYTPMHFAAKYGNIEVIKLLLKAGADKNVKNNHEYTPMHFAAKYGNIEVVKLLLKAGADLSVKNNCAETPLDTAYRRLIDDQKEKDESKKLKEKERRDLLFTISYLERQKAPCGRYLKSSVDEIRKQDKKQLKEKEAPFSRLMQIYACSLVMCGGMSVASFIFGVVANRSIPAFKEKVDAVSNGVNWILSGEQSKGGEQKSMPNISMVDATLMLLKDKNLDEKKKEALIQTTLLLIEKGQKPTPEHLQEVLKDPTVKVLFEQYGLDNFLIKDRAKASRELIQAKANLYRYRARASVR